MTLDEIKLRYGTNPHQKSARIFLPEGKLPLKIVNGEPSYINIIDALNSWQLVRELKQLTNIPAAASFKHTSPAGAAIGKPLSPELKKSLFVFDIELSPLAAAYARARGADRMATFGDWAAFSDPVDITTAQLLAGEVSDGCIAPDYQPEALAILKQKKNGKYPVLQIDPDYNPPPLEIRQLFGIYLEQERNNAPIDETLLQNVVTREKNIPEQTRIDLLLALITLKYTQSNSVVLTYDGQVVGVGAGQQSRIHCTRLACAKADKWFLRLHPRILNLKFLKGTTRAEKATAIDILLEETATPEELQPFLALLAEPPQPFTWEEKRSWLANFSGICLGSDGFIPFRDNLDRAARSNVRYVIQPGGSTRDQTIIDAADQYRMVMVFTNLRLFYH
ncbi:MAG: phosphoribosylaminoimidazolecarboxamide formyltransferase [candidate division WOR-3 bacterium]|nr:phosphoribosylaminoimidazolecarboxamide formyltransferase [candidate division WOR-3 bacterium]MCR4424563.1 phosphoribosylaminoimidazolecarboxamide formyltransferase [candidate division WOR-3 bacterium]MDH7519329.1 phosphoribosylaminoimidazolecarboxamide formyltransferase [bacterium]